jgi:hypothetical protein
MTVSAPDKSTMTKPRQPNRRRSRSENAFEALNPAMMILPAALVRSGVTPAVRPYRVPELSN